MLSLTRILLVILVIVISVTIGNISSIIRTHYDLKSSSKEEPRALQLNSSPPFPQNDDNISISFQDLIWFLQISDLHISIFREPDRLTDFEGFCKETVEVIKPPLVLASGDLTDAKTRDAMGSQQYEEEWRLYREALDKFEIRKKTIWLDVRGNHDIFNVMSSTDNHNYFRNYSIQGGNHSRSYLQTIKLASGKVVSFIALDSCLEPGPKRPFNFFGIINQQERENVETLISRSRQLNSSHSIWFGHYPTSCILSSSSQGVRELIASDTRTQAYLCGHLHTMMGAVPQMYTLQQAGFLELELADWKDSRIFRLAAIDQGVFSFIDVKFKEWPVVLVTNPKHALFQVPGRESATYISTSTHIRVLAFSTSNIISVRAKINNEDWHQCTHIKGPLYVSSWDPLQYARGLHNIQVEVVDKEGLVKVIKQPFSLDGTTLDFRILPRLLLMTSATVVFQVAFGLAVVGCVSPLCLMRILMARIKSGQKLIPFSNVSFIQSWYRRLWILANLNTFYYPLVLYPLYLAVGPWAIGELVDGHVGVIFAWGLFLNGSFLPGSFTYAFATLQMITFQFPLTAVLAYKLDKRLVTCNPKTGGKLLPVLSHCYREWTLYVILGFQLMMMHQLWLEYGWLAVLLGPYRSWPVVCTLYLWRQIRNTPLQYIQELANIFQETNPGSPQQKTTHTI